MERIVGLFIISLFISMFLYNTHFIASKHSATPSDILQKKYNKTAHHHNPPPNNFGINSEKSRTFLESIPKKATLFRNPPHFGLFWCRTGGCDKFRLSERIFTHKSSTLMQRNHPRAEFCDSHAGDCRVLCILAIALPRHS